MPSKCRHLIFAQMAILLMRTAPRNNAGFLAYPMVIPRQRANSRKSALAGWRRGRNTSHNHADFYGFSAMECLAGCHRSQVIPPEFHCRLPCPPEGIRRQVFLQQGCTPAAIRNGTRCDRHFSGMPCVCRDDGVRAAYSPSRFWKESRPLQTLKAN